MGGGWALTRSDDDGRTWWRLDTPTARWSINDDRWHGYALAYDTAAPNRLWIGGTYSEGYILASTDAGETWADAGTGEVGAVWDLQVQPERRWLYAATANGVWRLRLDP